MTESNAGRVTVEDLAEDYLERRRAGDGEAVQLLETRVLRGSDPNGLSAAEFDEQVSSRIFVNQFSPTMSASGGKRIL